MLHQVCYKIEIGPVRAFGSGIEPAEIYYAIDDRFIEYFNNADADRVSHGRNTDANCFSDVCPDSKYRLEKYTLLLPLRFKPCLTGHNEIKAKVTM